MSEESTPETTPEAPESPEIPEKFRNEDGSLNQEAILKSYSELERKKASEQESPTPNTEQPKTPPEKSPESIKGIQESTPPPDDLGKFSEYFQEFEESGSLSDESFDRLAEQGIPRELVESYMGNQKAIYDSQADQLINEAGGEENWNTMLKWAGNNWAPERVQEFDNNIAAYNLDKRAAAVRSLISEYRQANGIVEQAVTGASDSGVSSVVPYASDEQIRADMRDPRYKSDPAFRDKVRQKVAAGMGIGG